MTVPITRDSLVSYFLWQTLKYHPLFITCAMPIMILWALLMAPLIFSKLKSPKLLNVSPYRDQYPKMGREKEIRMDKIHVLNENWNWKWHKGHHREEWPYCKEPQRNHICGFWKTVHLIYFETFVIQLNAFKLEWSEKMCY